MALALLLIVVIDRAATRGLPVDRLTCLVIVAATCAMTARLRMERAGLARLVRDWAGLALVLVAYDWMRSQAPGLGAHVSYTWAPSADYSLTGQLPTAWLQAHLYGATINHWWNVLVSAVYLSHFWVPPATFGVLWLRSRRRFLAYRRRFVSLSFTGFVLYAAHPSAPPWMASDHGDIISVDRTASLGFEQLHLHAAGRLFAIGAHWSDTVAAFPSLHAAYTMLLLAFLWPQRSWPVRLGLVAYVLAMGFVLVLTAEHWVVDILAGWTLALLVSCAWHAPDRRS